MDRRRGASFLGVAFAGAALATITIGVPGSHAAPAWTLDTSPPAVRTLYGGLQGISCTTATACIAVGTRGGMVGEGVDVVPQAQRWDGHSWTLVATADLGTGQNGELRSVACANPTLCFGVGAQGSNAASISMPLVERWDGTQWTLVPVPVPGAANNATLNGISCGAPTSCVAVGMYSAGTEFGRLIEHWDGVHWSIESSPSPSPVHQSWFTSVSCPSATLCTAVGTTSVPHRYAQPLIERRTASGWSIATAAPAPPTYALDVIDCPDTWHCLAVGYRIAQESSGGHWTSVNQPFYSQPSGVDCVTSSDCVVTGSDQYQATMMRRRNGAWTADTVETTTRLSSLSAAACVNHVCQAVGSGGGPMHWRGSATSWLPVPGPQPSGAVRSVLLGVSCGSTSRCLAVGTAYGATNDTPFAITWDGTQWTAVPGAAGMVPPITDGQLDAVSCTAATECIAVGYGDNHVTEQRGAIAARWDGTHWHLLAVPRPTGLTDTSLAGVACVAANDCTAVGESNVTPGGALIERWNGSAWHVEGSNIASKMSRLGGIACVSASDCTAVGVVGKDFYGLTGVAHRSGSTWTVTPSPASPQIAELDGVDCASSSRCLAVGVDNVDFSDPGEPILPIAEQRIDTTWSMTSLPSSSQSDDSGLMGVSCTASTACWAVGGDGLYNPIAAIDQWDGAHWTVASLPAGAQALDAISCEPQRPCIAVGHSVLHYG